MLALCLYICEKHMSFVYSLLVLLQFLLLLLQDLDGTVNFFKLPRPRRVVEEWAQIEAVVVRTVGLGMISWRESCHLVTIDRVVKEEPLHLHRDLLGCTRREEKRTKT